jgi:phospholipase/carboxylesterase
LTYFYGGSILSVYVKEPKGQAQACVIWMHGLGADSSDMMGVAEQLMSTVFLRHVFIDAPMRPVTLNNGMVMPAWYDILGMKLTDREDKVGIEHSEALIRQTMKEQEQAGFSTDKIFLAGFSQGGAMALHTALHTKDKLAGVIALSAYLPLANFSKPILNRDTPFFIGSGLYDPVVLPAWTKQSQEWLTSAEYKNVNVHTYPMEHSICYEEVKDISSWLTQHTPGVSL